MSSMVLINQRQMILSGRLLNFQKLFINNSQLTSTSFSPRKSIFTAVNVNTVLSTIQTGRSSACIAFDLNIRRNYASMSFDEAVKKSTSMKDQDNSTKLRLYALYKQATVGKATGKRPGAMDFVGRAKYDAWNGLENMSQDEAKVKYAELVQSGLSDDTVQSSTTKAAAADGLDIQVADGVRTIRLNRPEKKNALTPDMYVAITNSLKEANTDDNTRVVVITGTGDYFCSGNDLGNFTNVTDPIKMAKDARDLLLAYVDAYIYCKKPLVAIVNGPAVGISVTVLGLCDAVFCTDQAIFSTPFSALGQSPEACSSYTFPKIMGYAKASELLFFNQRITASEAEKLGLITKVIPHDRLATEAWKRVNEMSALPIKSLVYSKELVRSGEREILHQVNVAECDRLQERWTSEDCMKAIMKFFSKQSKV